MEINQTSAFRVLMGMIALLLLLLFFYVSVLKGFMFALLITSVFIIYAFGLRSYIAKEKSVLRIVIAIVIVNLLLIGICAWLIPKLVISAVLPNLVTLAVVIIDLKKIQNLNSK